MKFTTLALALVLIAGLSGSACAASLEGASSAGRCALDAGACKAKDYFLTITDTTFVLQTYSCKGVAYDQSENKGGRALYAVTAKACVGEDSNTAKPDSFKLVADSGTMQILWRDGTKSGRMIRCGQ